ncbi:TetR/AcrR family transcriptional regulator [Actinocorallia longicatena]|uniref:HTH tetR-type domain-containing protein n=1 Tax=Actinocorallia longicatena TaxID=111803 RepID=A0ABP6Q5A9_9ACTN
MDKAARAGRIRAEALGVFAAKGYSATALAEIASAAGITRTSLYEHFASKRELYMAVLREQTEAAVAYVSTRVTGDGTPEQRMRAAVDAYFAYAETNPAAARLLFDRSREGDPELRELRREVRDGGIEVARVLLTADLAAVGIDPEPPNGWAAVEVIVSALDGGIRWWDRHPSTPRADLVDAVIATLKGGFAPA